MPAAGAQRRTARGRLFCFAMQSGPPLFPWGAAAENKRTSAVALRPRLWLPRHPQRPRGGPPFRRSEARAMTRRKKRTEEAAPPVIRAGNGSGRPARIARSSALSRHGRDRPADRHSNPCRAASAHGSRCRTRRQRSASRSSAKIPRRVIVAKHVETAKAGREPEGGKMGGGEAWGKAGKRERSESTVSMPSPAAMMSFGGSGAWPPGVA